jgi:hypothetical protein
MNGEFARECDLIYERHTPGVCFNNGKVYAFGSGNATETSEAYSVSEKLWFRLPDGPQKLGHTS